MDMQATYTHWLIVLCLVLAVLAFHARLRSHTAAQQAEARASEERLRQISDNIPGMIAYWDQQRVCRFANRAFCALLDLAPGQLVGMSLDDLFLPRFDAKWRPVADAPGGGPAEDTRRRRIAAALGASGSASITAIPARTARSGIGSANIDRTWMTAKSWASTRYMSTSPST